MRRIVERLLAAVFGIAIAIAESGRTRNRAYACHALNRVGIRRITASAALAAARDVARHVVLTSVRRIAIAVGVERRARFDAAPVRARRFAARLGSAGAVARFDSG